MENWQIDYDAVYVTDEQSKVIEDLLRRLGTATPQVEDIWCLMDEVWDQIGIDNRSPSLEMLEEFYRHPVWLLNSLFVESDVLSMSQRKAINNWIESRAGEIKRVIDFGGGLGTLGMLIAQACNDISVDIYEPYASRFAEDRIDQFPNVRFVGEPVDLYDCLVSVDVLEHVTNPLELLSEMAGNLRNGGYMIIANNFHPVIKCHLPGTFHLRFTFRLFARLMGLIRLGPCHGSHATVYRKTEEQLNWPLIKVVERMSKFSYYPLHVPYFFYRFMNPVNDQ